MRAFRIGVAPLLLCSALIAACGGRAEFAGPWVAASDAVAQARPHQAGPALPSPTPTPGSHCGVRFYPPVGAAAPSPIPLHGPGLILGGGGTDVDAEFVWLHDTLTGYAATRGGDVVVLRASGTADYDRYIARLAKFNSVRTLKLPPCATLADITAAAAIVDASSALFLAGGNQADYVRWKNTPLQAAIANVYRRGGVVGGTSAGEESVAQFVFDAVVEGNTGNVTTRNAVHDPYEKIISFTYDFFSFPPLHHVFADAHFVTRNRFGRLAVFMTRQIADGQIDGKNPVVHGIGVDEASSLVVDKNGLGTLLLQGRGGSAFFLSTGPARQIVSHNPFVSGTIAVTKLDRALQVFDLHAWCGTEPAYDVTVDGSMDPIYAPDPPYRVPDTARGATC